VALIYQRNSEPYCSASKGIGKPAEQPEGNCGQAGTTITTRLGKLLLAACPGRSEATRSVRCLRDAQFTDREYTRERTSKPPVVGSNRAGIRLIEQVAATPSHNIQLQRIREHTCELWLSDAVRQELDVEVGLTEGPGKPPLL
jgi:hypothetical protein